MAVPPTMARCPACGTALAVLLAPSPPTQWFNCPHCHAPVPVLVPRDPPPLYTWEVLPALYPALAAPRAPRWAIRRVSAGALFALAVASFLLAGVFGYYAAIAPTPGTFTVTGTVLGEPNFRPAVPLYGAEVVALEENGHRLSTTTRSDGTFVLGGVPTGGLAVNISDPGYAPVTVQIFLSTIYSAGANGISVTLLPGQVGNASTESLTSYVDLETFVAAIGGGVVVLGFVGVLTGYASMVTRRDDRPAVGIVGGGAGLLAPLAIAFLTLGEPFPNVLTGSVLLAAVGAFVLALRTVEMGQVAGAPD
jgi:carboxypeptidase family protein